MNKSMRHVRLSMPLSIKELRLLQGITIREASELSGITIDRIKRWERKGVANVNIFYVWTLLNAYNTNLESCDCNRIPSKEQIYKAILVGTGTQMPNHKLELDLDKAILLLEQEGLNAIATGLIGFREDVRQERLIEKQKRQTVGAAGA